MSERSEHKDLRGGYVYDAQIKGVDTTYWSELSGTLAAASNKLRFNADQAASFIQHRYGKYTFAINVPTNPASADNRVWGLQNPQAATYGSAYFTIDSDAAFTATSYDDFGNAQTTTLTWDSDHSAAETRYGISWEPEGITFLINDTAVARHGDRVGTGTQSILVQNDNSDNMDLGYIEVKNAKDIV